MEICERLVEGAHRGNSSLYIIGIPKFLRTRHGIMVNPHFIGKDAAKAKGKDAVLGMTDRASRDGIRMPLRIKGPVR